MGVLCWAGREQKVGVQGRGTPQDGLVVQGLHDHQGVEVQEGPGVEGWGWTWETCRGEEPGISGAA